MQVHVMFKKILAVVFLLISSSLWAEESKYDVEDVAFSHLFVSLQAGELYPWGQLQDAVDNSVYLGGGIRYTYWDDFDGFVQMEYSYFIPAMDNEIIYGVHQVNGKLGLSYHNPKIKSVELGAGFLCSWTRADYDETKVDKKTFKNELGGTLVDNETEFGWFFRLLLPVWTTDNYRVGLNAEWQELWTLPERSNMVSVGIFVERRIW